MVVSIAKKLKDYPLVICYIAIEHGYIHYFYGFPMIFLWFSHYKWPFIVDLPIKDGDFPVRFLHVYQAGSTTHSSLGMGPLATWRAARTDQGTVHDNPQLDMIGYPLVI